MENLNLQEPQFCSAKEVHNFSEQRKQFQLANKISESKRLEAELEKKNIETKRFEQQIKLQNIQLQESKSMNRINIFINVATAIAASIISVLGTLYFSN